MRHDSGECCDQRLFSMIAEPPWLIAPCRLAATIPRNRNLREPGVKPLALQPCGLKRASIFRGQRMAVRRKRFRIEDIENAAAPADDDPAIHHDIMAELAELRRQMAQSFLNTAQGETAAPELSAAKAMLESYRAQIAQCEKLKIELDLIHAAINRTKQEIAVLHGKSFSGAEMAKVTGELGAVVGGTEEATQQILAAAEAIDHAAGMLTKVSSPEQQRHLSEDIQERVISIFEACNFQDLTGQRISKVMSTMKFIEHHINVMMDIWGGVDAIKAHAPPDVDERVGDARLLNGPKAPDAEDHASQDEIDALFG
jgi:chemotaxis protein CheZ